MCMYILCILYTCIERERDNNDATNNNNNNNNVHCVTDIVIMFAILS